MKTNIRNQHNANIVWNSLRDPRPNLIDVKWALDALLAEANKSWWRRLVKR